MKNILTQIFVTLGVIFLIFILIATYFFITDPYNLRPLFFPSNSAKTQPTNASAVGGGSVSGSSAGSFQLSEAQKQALINLGVDPATVPTSISAEQEACFTAELGASRVAEIKTGAVPNAIEFFRAKSCI